MLIHASAEAVDRLAVKGIEVRCAVEEALGATNEADEREALTQARTSLDAMRELEWRHGRTQAEGRAA
jgi:hypothetical protein